MANTHRALGTRCIGATTTGVPACSHTPPSAGTIVALSSVMTSGSRPTTAAAGTVGATVYLLVVDAGNLHIVQAIATVLFLLARTA